MISARHYNAEKNCESFAVPGWSMKKDAYQFETKEKQLLHVMVCNAATRKAISAMEVAGCLFLCGQSQQVTCSRSMSCPLVELS
jgi:hypothetical protein